MSNKYTAWASNEQGATMDIDYPMHEPSCSMRALENAARNTLGSGWTVHIVRVLIDGDGQSTMGVEEVKKFRIR